MSYIIYLTVLDSGHLLLCVPPSGDYEPLHSVKWHPKDPEKLAVASDSRIYLIDLATTLGFQNRPVSHAELHMLGQMFTVASVRHRTQCIYHVNTDIVHSPLSHLISMCSTMRWQPFLRILP